MALSSIAHLRNDSLVQDDGRQRRRTPLKRVIAISFGIGSASPAFSAADHARSVPARSVQLNRGWIGAWSGRQEERQMETRTVEVMLQHPDGRMVARLTVRYPPPAA